MSPEPRRGTLKRPRPVVMVRTAAQRGGLWAEQRAERLLQGAGWRPLARRWRCRWGELDLLLCEIAHIPLQELLEKLRGQKIRKIVFTHLERGLWADRERVRREAKRVLGPIPFAIAQDGDEFPF